MPADDFDDSTPPPRVGRLLVRAYQRLPAGEDVPAMFARWQKARQVPDGCRLVRFVGTPPPGPPTTPATPSGYRHPDGTAAADAELAGLGLLVTLVVEAGRGRGPEQWCVFGMGGRA